MSDLLSLYATDVEKEQQGVWTDDLGGGMRLKIARLRNSNFKQLYQKLTKPYERQIRARTLDEATENRILNQCLAKTVLLGWENLTYAGQKLEHSLENALSVLSDPRLVDFRDLVVDIASDAQFFRDESLEQAEKNLPSGLDGASNGEPTSDSSGE